MPFQDDDDSPGRYRDFHDEEESWDEEPEVRDRTPDDYTTVRCIRCKKLIFEDADQCPYCKHWQTRDHEYLKPLWFVTTVFICVAAIVVFWIMRRVL